MDEREERWRMCMLDARSGDQAAYRRLLSDVGERVRRLARRRLARSGYSLDEAEDIVQEVLVAVHTKRDTWDAERPIGPWVDAIIRYKTSDALRRLKRRSVATDTLDVVAETIAAAPRPVEPGQSVHLDRHLRALPTRERGVVAALGLDGLTVAKCAEQFGISEVAVRVAFHRGLARLARLADGKNGAASLSSGQRP